jgi:hypothetical protein
MAKNIPILRVVLDFGGSGTKVVACLDHEQPIFFLMPPQCVEVAASECSHSEEDAYSETSLWISIDETYYAFGLLAQQHSSNAIKVKPLKVELAPVKSVAAIAIAAQRLSINKKVRLDISIVLPSGEMAQKAIFQEEMEALLSKKISSPWGPLQGKLWVFNAEIEGKGILLHHRRTSKVIKNTMVLMLGYRNASFVITQGKLIATGGCSELGFHVFLRKLVNLTSGYSVERLLIPITQYVKTKTDSFLTSVLRFSPESPHRPQELIDLKLAIDTAEVFYVQQIIAWLAEFLPSDLEIEELVLAGGGAPCIVYALSDKLVGRFVSSTDCIYLYEADDLPPLISKVAHGERFLDIYAVWERMNSCA